MPQFYVYVYRDPSRNNEPIYVGKGCGKRAYGHRYRKDTHPFVQRLQLMKRNGVEPHIEIIRCNNEEVALTAEILSIKIFGRKDLGKGTLLNLTDGGEGTSNPPWKGKPLHKDTRAKMSEARKGRLCSQAAKDKISAANKNLPLVTCPHCGFVGKSGAMKQWHFDNCKYRK